MVYKNLDPNSLIEKHPVVNEISITQRSSDERDLALQLYLDENTYQVRRKLPNRIQDVPVEYIERPTTFGQKCSGDSTTSSCSANSTDDDCRVGVGFTTLGGNIDIDDGDGSHGTLAFVAYNDDSGDPYECLITADHVMEGASTMYHVGQAVGTHEIHSLDMDATKYRVKSGIDVNPRETVESSQPNVTGTWDYAGLTDKVETNDGTVSCKFAGRETCCTGTECNSTSKNDAVTYEADMKNVVTEHGDSGGPFVDPDGKLVCTLTGCQEYFGDYWDRGPVGTEFLDSINAVLYDPSKLQ